MHSYLAQSCPYLYFESQQSPIVMNVVFCLARKKVHVQSSVEVYEKNLRPSLNEEE